MNPWIFIYGKYDSSSKLQSLYYENKDYKSPFGPTDRQKLVMVILKASQPHRGAGLDINKLVNKKQILELVPLHDHKQLQHLKERWFSSCSPWSLPLDNCDAFMQLDPAGKLVGELDRITVKDYYGEKVAMYFAWLAHYTRQLILPSLVGVAIFIHQYWENSLTVQTVPFYAFFMGIWVTVYLEDWKRTQARYAMKWGTFNHEATEEPRPQFKGEMRPCPVTGELKIQEMNAKKCLKNSISL